MTRKKSHYTSSFVGVVQGRKAVCSCCQRSNTPHTCEIHPPPTCVPYPALPCLTACVPTVRASARDAQGAQQASSGTSAFPRHLQVSSGDLSLPQASRSEQCSSVGPEMPSSRRLSSDG